LGLDVFAADCTSVFFLPWPAKRRRSRHRNPSANRAANQSSNRDANRPESRLPNRRKNPSASHLPKRPACHAANRPQSRRKNPSANPRENPFRNRPANRSRNGSLRGSRNVVLSGCSQPNRIYFSYLGQFRPTRLPLSPVPGPFCRIPRPENREFGRPSLTAKPACPVAVSV